MHRHVIATVVALVYLCPVFAQSPTAEQKAATVAYVQSLQKENGGFAADQRPETPSTLPATNSALRALKYFGGQLKDKAGCEKFVRSCFDPATGTYRPTPNGKPDARTMALGVMVAAELKLPASEFADQTKFMSFVNQNAKTFEDMRMGAAGYEAVGMRFSTPHPWVAEINKLRNPDGTYGRGGNVARDTGGAAAAILRLGGQVEQKDKVIKALKTGQQPDGGFGREGQTGSDLETTYRIMRAFFMLKEKPDVEACRAFVAKCRNKDGSYSLQPGQPGNISATYFAGIILHWLDGMK